MLESLMVMCLERGTGALGRLGRSPVQTREMCKPVRDGHRCERDATVRINRRCCLPDRVSHGKVRCLTRGDVGVPDAQRQVSRTNLRTVNWGDHWSLFFLGWSW